MISVFKNTNEIIVRCTSSDMLNIEKIKGIIKTIKKIDSNNQHPCQVIIKDVDNILFTKTGEQFYNRILRRRFFDGNRTNICFE